MASEELSQEKIKRLIVASTVGAVLFLVILLCIMVYQILAINHQEKLKEEYEVAFFN